MTKQLNKLTSIELTSITVDRNNSSLRFPFALCWFLIVFATREGFPPNTIQMFPIDVMTWMEDSRPRNKTMWVVFDVESVF